MFRHRYLGLNIDRHNIYTYDLFKFIFLFTDIDVEKYSLIKIDADRYI